MWGSLLTTASGNGRRWQLLPGSRGGGRQPTTECRETSVPSETTAPDPALPRQGRGGTWTSYPRTALGDIPPIIALAALTLVFFWKLAFTGLVLGGYDVQTYISPYRHEVADALRHGRLPLWNPYLFLGAPLMANIQTAVFYPFNLVYELFPTPYATNMAVILHIFLAGLFMYGFCRSSFGLDRISCSIGALAFMFSGFMGAQAGHVNQVSVAAWLPCLLLCFDRATQHRSSRWVTCGALVVTVQFLAGHSQESYLMLVTFGLYILFRLAFPLAPPGSHDSPGPTQRIVVLLAAGSMLVLGVGMALFQLLTTLELAGESIRAGGLSYTEAVSFSLRPWDVLAAILPGFVQNPFSEFVGYIGIFGLVLCGMAVVLRWRRPETWFCLFLMVIGIFFALGGFNPLWIYAHAHIPGFKLFRVPARWLYVYTFGAASLAALGSAALRTPSARKRGWPALWRHPVFLCALALIAVTFWLTHSGDRQVVPSVSAVTRWSYLFGTSTALGVVALVFPWRTPFQSCFAICLTLELFAASRVMDYNAPLPSDLYTDIRPTEAFLLSDHEPYRVLSIAEDGFDTGDQADLERLYTGLLGHDTARKFVSGTKWKEMLTPNVPLSYHINSLDGYDGGVLPLRRYVDLKRLYVPPCTGCDNPDAILRNQLIAVPDLKWLSFLNVKYIIADKLHDAWDNNVYYDLGNLAQVDANTGPLRLRGFTPTVATALGIVTYLTDATSLPQDTIVARVTVTDTAGQSVERELKAGSETAEGSWTRGASHGKAHALSLWKNNSQAYTYLAVLPSGPERAIRSIDVTYTGPSGHLTVLGASLIDQPLTSFVPLTISQDGALSTAISGDLKVYENHHVSPRAYLLHQMTIVPDDVTALRTLAEIDPLPGERGTAVITYPTPRTHASRPYRVIDRLADTLNGTIRRTTEPPRLAASTMKSGEADRITFSSITPEHIDVSVITPSSGYLLVSNEYFPGWYAELDGSPTELYQTDDLLMSVYVPSGQHSVVIRYRSRYLRLGAVMSTGAAMVAMLLALLPRRWPVPRVLTSLLVATRASNHYRPGAML